jgi:hypothetical protein
LTTTNTFIRSYGLFWRREEVNWSPGAGNAGQFRLLGRKGTHRPTLRVADFRDQRGIYVLLDDYGPYYVGLARQQAIGNRLRSHTRDLHADRWDRFSWFGFRRIKVAKETNGLQKLGAMPSQLVSGTSSTIGDIEALMMVTLGTVERGNAQTMKFKNADRWEQVPLDRVDHWMARVGR